VGKSLERPTSLSPGGLPPSCGSLLYRGGAVMAPVEVNPRQRTGTRRRFPAALCPSRP